MHVATAFLNVLTEPGSNIFSIYCSRIDPVNVFFFMQSLQVQLGKAYFSFGGSLSIRGCCAVIPVVVGADADDILNKAGVVSTGRLANLATQQLPPPVMMVVNKAVGFRLIGQVGEKATTRLGKAIPFAGGFVGAGIDSWMLHKVADNARDQFPAR